MAEEGMKIIIDEVESLPPFRYEIFVFRYEDFELIAKKAKIFHLPTRINLLRTLIYAVDYIKIPASDVEKIRNIAILIPTNMRYVCYYAIATYISAKRPKIFRIILSIL
ncbi:MAG: hypothetical protein Q6363_007935 [Candidatus Njordarchaeota archaeon]